VNKIDSKIKINKNVIRCKKCGKRLLDGLPGMDIATGRPKILEIICPRSDCGAMNVITCRMKVEESLEFIFVGTPGEWSRLKKEKIEQWKKL